MRGRSSAGSYATGPTSRSWRCRSAASWRTACMTRAWTFRAGVPTTSRTVPIWVARTTPSSRRPVASGAWRSSARRPMKPRPSGADTFAWRVRRPAWPPRNRRWSQPSNASTSSSPTRSRRSSTGGSTPTVRWPTIRSPTGCIAGRARTCSSAPARSSSRRISPAASRPIRSPEPVARWRSRRSASRSPVTAG